MSVTTVHADLRAAVRQKLQTLTALPSVHWEGKDFTPTKGQPYVSESFRPINSVVRALGAGGVIAHTCTANFTLHYPANEGTNAIDQMAGALMHLFRPGTSLAYGDSTAVTIQAERMALTQEPDWLNCAVVVTLTARTLN